MSSLSKLNALNLNRTQGIVFHVIYIHIFFYTFIFISYDCVHKTTFKISKNKFWYIIFDEVWYVFSFIYMKNYYKIILDRSRHRISVGCQCYNGSAIYRTLGQLDGWQSAWRSDITQMAYARSQLYLRDAGNGVF